MKKTKKFFLRIILIVFVSFYSCEKIKKKGNKIFKKSRNKISNLSEKVWKKSIKFAFNNSFTTEKISLDEIYPDASSLSIKMLGSIKINFPSNFYSCYFKYKSDKVEILNFLSNLKTRLPDISDKKYIKIEKAVFLEKFDFIEKTIPKINKKIEFFKQMENIKNMEYYRCNKYPNSNFIAIDIKSGIIYHLIENYWD